MMKISVNKIVMFFITVIALTACSNSVATVNGKKISREAFNVHLRERMEDYKRQNISLDEKSLKNSILQELVDERIALDEAAVRNITVSDADVNQEIETMKRRVGNEQFLKSLRDKKTSLDALRQGIGNRLIHTKFIESFVSDKEVTEEETDDYYRNSQTPFIRPARVLMRIAEFESEDAAWTAASELKRSKEDFDIFMKKLADAGKAALSEYGWVTPDFFSSSIAASIKGIKEGQHGGPYKGQRGFFLARIKEKESEGVSSYDEMKGTIKNILLQQKRAAAYLQWLEQKRGASKIIITLK
ncbi:MAG: SurA N-terminal domain-containing protein [Nitrospirae bacterium]|nr:SurA N-terminal domain-containing protein [Nitrospirota bacterium]